MAESLQNATELELLNHYLDSGSIALINENEDEGEKAGTGEQPARQCFSPHSSPEADGRGINFSGAGGPAPGALAPGHVAGRASHHLTPRRTVFCLN